MRLRTVALAVVPLLVAVGAAAPAAAAADRSGDPAVRVTGPSPFEPGCNGTPQTGTLFPNGEVEPWVAVNPSNTSNQIGVWQQDRWSNGGAQGLLTAVSNDSGKSWTTVKPPPFSRCAGGNPANGGDYERASDPWVTYSPNGDAYQISLSINDSNPINAVLVSKSRDGGETWGPITTLIRDTDPRFFNDKESITADSTDSRFVYAVWDRLDIPGDGTFRGPAVFSRTTDGGASWEEPRVIFDPGVNNQTIGNQIAVLPSGELINVFTYIIGGNLNVAVMRSSDKGETWTEPLIVNQLGTVGVSDPRDGAPVRTGDIIPDIAVDPRRGHDNVYLTWQDARFTGGQADQIVLSRSTDGGRTWSLPTRVSENVDTQAFTAAVDVDRRGQLAVTYYDFTADTVESEALETDYWVTGSRNGGRSFSPRVRLTDMSFDMRTAPDAGGFFVGDYEGLDAVGRDFTPFFALANSGDAANPTDMFATSVRAPSGRSQSTETLSGGSASTFSAPGQLSEPRVVRRR